MKLPSFLSTFFGLSLFIAGCDAFHRTQSEGAGERVEAAIFEGGYGIHWHQAIAAEYNNTGAGALPVDVWGDPRVFQKVKPRILRGDPPPFLLMQNLPVWQMIAAGKLEPFDPLLDEPLPGHDKTWRESFMPGTLDLYKADGKCYAIPSALGAYTIWYDARQFREHGWEPPKTWAEFTALCEAIQAAGVAPFAFQGKYPIYAFWGWQTLIHRCGGLAAINRINAMEPGAFSHPDVVRSAELLQYLAVNYFQKGAMAMNHTESQLQFVENKAAMIFCGLWLSNEMKANTPADFEMRCFNVPEVEGGKGNSQLFNGSGWEFIYIASDGAHTREAMEFARYMVSPERAPSMAETIGVISPLAKATPRKAVDGALQSALDLIEDAEGIFTLRVDTLLLEWRNEVMVPLMGQLLQGGITPEAFCQALDAGVLSALADPNIVVPPNSPYDPAAFGEES